MWYFRADDARLGWDDPDSDRGQEGRSSAAAAIAGYQGQEPVVQPERAGSGSNTDGRKPPVEILIRRREPELSVWAFYPPREKVKQGLDLKGRRTWS